MKKQEAVKKHDPVKESQKPEPVKQEAMKQEPTKCDPYDSRTICPDIPKCCVVGDLLDNSIQYISEAGDNV